MENLQLLEIKHLGATNTKGTRIKIIDHRYNNYIVLSKDYKYSLHFDQVAGIIKRKDLIEGISYSEKLDTYFVILNSDNNTNTFLTLKELF